jgi:hypothetical protein
LQPPAPGLCRAPARQPIRRHHRGRHRVRAAVGTSTLTLTFKLSLLPNVRSGAYNSTWTLTIASGP